MMSPLFLSVFGFLKNHRKGGSRFPSENGGSSYRGLSIEGGGGGGGKHCFSLIRYKFFSSNALYFISFSFKIFIFLLTPCDTFDCYYFGPNLSQVLLIKVLFIKKHVTLFFSLLKMKKRLFLCLSGISMGQYSWKKSCQKRGLEKI